MDHTPHLNNASIRQSKKLDNSAGRFDEAADCLLVATVVAKGILGIILLL